MSKMNKKQKDIIQYLTTAKTCAVVIVETPEAKLSPTTHHSTTRRPATQHPSATLLSKTTVIPNARSPSSPPPFLDMLWMAVCLLGMDCAFLNTVRKHVAIISTNAVAAMCARI